MKILLINPERLINPPFGLLYIGSVLKAMGHDAELVEIPFGLTQKERSKFLDAKIREYRPRIAGITCMSMQASIAKEVVKSIKEAAKDVCVVVGGVHPTIDSHDVLSWGTDICVRGEGERTILEVVDFCNGVLGIESIKGISYRKGAEMLDNPDREAIKNLDELPPLSYELLEKSRFRNRSYSIRGFWLRCAWIMTTRGCPGRCIFCASKTMHGRVVREFSLDRMLDEVSTLKRNYKVEGLWVFDDTFTLKERRVVEFCEGLKERKIRLIWACQARVDTFTRRMAEAMRSSGCVQVDFGVESGSQKVLDYIKKDIRCEETRRAFRIAKETGMRALATVMVGLPTETEEDFKMTEVLIREIRPNFVAPFFATPYPGTELYRMAVDNKWIDISKEINWQQMEEPLMVMDMPHEKIKRMLEKLLEFNKSAMLEYLRQPRFIYDLLKVFLKYPKFLLQSVFYASRLRQKDLMNLFVNVFRKEMVEG